MPPWQARDDGIDLRVRLTPKGSVDRVEGRLALSDGSVVLAAKVRAVPEDGAANAALVRLIADAFDVARSAVAVTHGHQSRLKELRITGNPAALLDRAAGLWP